MNLTDTSAALAEALALREAATHDPYIVHPPNTTSGWGWCVGPAGTMIARMTGGRGSTMKQRQADAAFLAAAPDLVTLAERLAAERDEARAELTAIRASATPGNVAKTITGTVLGASMSSASDDPDYDGLGYVTVYAPSEQIAGVTVGRGSKATVTVYEWSDEVAHDGSCAEMLADDGGAGC